MALHTKKLYYRRGGTTYSIDLYTTTAEVGSEYIALDDAGTIVYAAIVSEGSNGESYLRIRKSGITKSVLTTMAAQELSALINYDISNSLSYPGSGTALTDIGMAPTMNATLYNGVGYSSENGGVLTFDGINDYGLIPYNAAMNSTSFSVLTWFCITTFPGYSQYRIVTRQDATAYGGSGYNCWGYQMGRGDYVGQGGTSSEILMFMHANGPSSVKNLAGATRMALNIWYHGGFTTDGTTHTIYLNGAADGSTSGTGQLSATTYPIDIGALTTNANKFFFPGKIGQIKFFNSVLTPAQITQEFNATKARFGL